MIYLFTKNVYLGMNVLFWMNSHSYSTSHYILYKLIHAILDLFVVFRLLYITFNVIKELFLRLFSVRIK